MYLRSRRILYTWRLYCNYVKKKSNAGGCGGFYSAGFAPPRIVRVRYGSVCTAYARPANRICRRRRIDDETRVQRRPRIICNLAARCGPATESLIENKICLRDFVRDVVIVRSQLQIRVQKFSSSHFVPFNCFFPVFFSFSTMILRIKMFVAVQQQSASSETDGSCLSAVYKVLIDSKTDIAWTIGPEKSEMSSDVSHNRREAALPLRDTYLPAQAEDWFRI